MSGREETGKGKKGKFLIIKPPTKSSRERFDATPDGTSRVPEQTFEDLYFSKAYGVNYDRRNPPEKMRYYLDRIREIQPHGSLLDVGCGYGLFVDLARQYFQVTGCDISAHALEIARNRFPHIPFVRSEVQNLSLEDTFEVVTCFDVLEHVPDLSGALRSISVRLKPEGIIVITVPVYDTAVGALVGILDKDNTHVWKQGRKFWRESLRSSGFEIMKDIGLWRYFLFGKRYIFFGSDVWRNFSPAILLIGKKR